MPCNPDVGGQRVVELRYIAVQVECRLVVTVLAHKLLLETVLVAGVCLLVAVAHGGPHIAHASTAAQKK